MNHSTFLRFLGGTVTLSVKGYGTLRLVERCRKEGLRPLLVAPGEEEFRLTIWYWQKKKFPRLAQQAGVEWQVLEQKGLPALLAGYRRRYGLWLGILLSAAFLAYTQCFVWEIHLDTSDPAQQELVWEYLEEAGIGLGTPWSQVDTQGVAQQLYFANRNTSFAALNRNGCSLEVIFHTSPQTTLPQQRYQNMVAAKDGLVLRVEALSGTAAVEPGQTVRQGQVVISGVGDTDGGDVWFSSAQGMVYAQTVTQKTFSFSLTQQEVLPNAPVWQGRVLHFFHLSLPLQLSSQPMGETQSQTRYLTLFGTQLPIGIEEIQVQPVGETQTLYTQEQGQAILLAQADRYEEEELDPVEVQQRSESFSLEGDTLFLQVEWVCEEQIARSLPFDVNSSQN